MNNFTSFSIFLFLLNLATNGFSSTVEIQNNCNYDVWVAALPGGGKRLLQNQTWTISPVTKDGDELAIWGRTNCIFDKSGQGKCISGDCNGIFHCRDKPRTSVTLASIRTHIAFSQTLSDYFGISVLDGYNIPMQFTSIYAKFPVSIIGLKYTTTSSNGICPRMSNIRGCDKYCTVIKNKRHCYQTCQNKLNQPNKCPDKDPQDILQFYEYPSGGNQYNILFCP